MRTCEGCTLCCQGYLKLTIDGVPVTKDTPCKNCEEGVGCQDYENRPVNPCQSYKCEWLISETIPEWMSPIKTKAIITTKDIDDIPYLMVTEAGQKLDSEVLTWLFLNSIRVGANLTWECNNSVNYIGSAAFTEAMKKHLEDLDKRKIIKIYKG